MNFLQKYNLAITIKYGKGYVSVEEVGHVIHELEETVQFLKLKVNELEHNLLDKSAQLSDANISIDRLHSELTEEQASLTTETMTNLVLAVSSVLLLIIANICLYKLLF